MLTELYKTTSASQPRTFLFATSEGDIDSLRYSTTQLPQTPSMIIVTIAATRMYRALINLFSSEM